MHDASSVANIHCVMVSKISSPDSKVMVVPYLMNIPGESAPNPTASLREFRTRSCRVPSGIDLDLLKLTRCTTTMIDISTHTCVFACSFLKIGILVLHFWSAFYPP